jgi:hypothetical protein
MRAWMLPVLGGCVSHPLDEVPIHGATAEQERVVREAIAEFEGWIGAGRVELGRVTFGGIDRGAGRYWPDARRIRIEEGLQGSALRRVVHHELCHAVDHQDDLLDAADPVFDRLVDQVRGDDRHPLHDVVGRSRRVDRSELFAQLCENGPAWNHVVANSCPGDPAELAPAASWIVDEVWTGEVDLSFGLGPTPRGLGSFESAWEVDQLEFLGGRDEAAVLVTAYSPRDPDGVGSMMSRNWRDLVTGELVPYEVSGRWLTTLDAARSSLPAELPVGLPSPQSLDADVSDPVDSVVQGGLALVVTRRVPLYDWSTGTPLSPRVWAWDGEGWSLVDACPSRLSSVFAAPDGLYLGDADAPSGHVSWSVVEW